MVDNVKMYFAILPVKVVDTVWQGTSATVNQDFQGHTVSLLIAGRMFVKMEVVVLVLIYVLVGLDGKENTAEDQHVILDVKMEATVIYPIGVAVSQVTGGHFASFHHAIHHVLMVVDVQDKIIAAVENITQANIV